MQEIRNPPVNCLVLCVTMFFNLLVGLQRTKSLQNPEGKLGFPMPKEDTSSQAKSGMKISARFLGKWNKVFLCSKAFLSIPKGNSSDFSHETTCRVTLSYSIGMSTWDVYGIVD